MATTHDWRFKDECFKKRSQLLSSLVRVGMVVTQEVYEFCDFTLSQGWNPPLDERECDNQTLEMYRSYLKEVKNGQ
jgi:hypothetical protein